MKTLIDTTRAPMLVLMLAVTLLAFGLRVHRLENKSIWWDEGSSAWQATQDLATITLYQARDQHPPLFYWTLHLWNRSSGQATFTLRFFSVVWGTLCIPLAFALGRALAGSSVGLLAALFMAMARFHIWWSQELKMYAMVSFLSMASTYVLILILRATRVLPASTFVVTTSVVQEETTTEVVTTNPDSDSASLGIRSNEPVLWLIYVVVTVLALYAHYLSLPIVLSQNLFLAILLVVRVKDRRLRRSLFVRWSASQAALAALFAFWFLMHRQYSASWGSEPALSVAAALRLVTTLLSLGISTHTERYTWVVLALWLPLLVGLVPLLRQGNKRWGGLLLWLCLIVPPSLIYGLSLPRQGFLYEAKIAPRFFLVSVIPYALLLAWSLVLIGRRFIWAGVLGVALVVTSSAVSLSDYYTSRYLRDDYQTLVRIIQAYAQPGDAILLDTDVEWPVFEYYYTGSLPWHKIPAGEDMSAQKAQSRLEPMWTRHDGLWVVFTPDALVRDPQGFIENWLGQNGQVILDRRFADKRLVLYSKLPRRLVVTSGDNFTIQHPLTLPMDEGINLVGYDQALQEIRTGDTLRLVTYWQATSSGSLTSLPPVQAVLLDSGGTLLSQAIASWDSDGGGLIDSVGATLRAQHDLDISSAVPSGTYDVCLALSTAAGDAIEPATCLGTVRVVRIAAFAPPVEEQQIQHPASERLGSGIRFLGYDLATDAYRSGDVVELTMYWQALEKMDTSYVVFVHLLGKEFNPATGNFLWGQVDQVPVAGSYPTTAWAVGETVVDTYQVSFHPDAPPGIYEIEIGLYEPVTGQRLPVLDEAGQQMGDRILLQKIELLR